jgi:hypothetical protein
MARRLSEELTAAVEDFVEKEAQTLNATPD